MTETEPVGAAEKAKIGTLAGLPGLSLDALTSVAYGPEAIVIVLAASSSGAIATVRPITVAIIVLLAILVFSYRQVIAAYPDGGGAYAVSKSNLGQNASLLAGASLIVDYVLTVAVSITAGVAALASAFPALASVTVPVGLALLVLLTVLNLFGLSESARAFLIPTLVFIGGLYVVVVVGLVHPLGSAGPRLPAPTTVSTVGILLVLKAFASGCSALTGVEAIANGTPSFKEPRVKRAQRTELLLGIILGSLLLGLAQLTTKFHLHPKANITLLSQITERAVGHGAGYYIVELATTAALGLAANTSFGGLPVLASLLARDNFLPRVFTLHGERTVYRYGVVVLAVLAGLLIVGSGGNTQTLIPLYAIGVFIGFTLAQSGLVRHWSTHHGRLWAARAAINGTGAVLSAAAAVIFLATKFIHGAFITVVVIPALIVMFRQIHRYYDTLGEALGLGEEPPRPDGDVPGLVLVPVVGLSRLTSAVLSHALATGGEVRALHAAFEGEPTEALEAAWRDWHPGVPLIVVPSPERSVTRAFLRYMESPEVSAHPNVIVLIGEIEPRKLRHRLLLNQRGTILASFLRRHTDAAIATIPFRLD
ncbi:MAG TPA: APC family permease [Acidimicrobiales bacterium]|nr:APC family permease [Acidimicrobiales bacterium]